MPRKKITPQIKEIVLKLKRQFPNKGVRALTYILEDKHDIKISKSALHKILKEKGIKSKLGRKKAIKSYQTKAVEHCGLILLRCLDYQIGFFQYLAKELRAYLPKLPSDILKELLILGSFSSFIGDKDIHKSIKREGFLRLASLNHFPATKFKELKEKISQSKPAIKLGQIKENVRLASTIKFYFKSGYIGFADARMSTLWNGPCESEHFFLSLKGSISLIQRMIKEKALIVGYTKSFGYLSMLSFNFLKAIDSGIERIEFLGINGEVLKELDITIPKLSFFIGYSPKILNRGFKYLGQLKRYNRFFWEEIGEYMCNRVLTRFTQAKEDESLVINNVLIKQSTAKSPTWGILTGNVSSQKSTMAAFMKRYFYLWPNAEEGFNEDMDILQKEITNPSIKENYLEKMVPSKLVFRDINDLSFISQILSAIFKEVVYGWEPKGKKGDFTLGKEYLKISFKKAPKQVKRNFNRSCFYLDEKRALVI